MLKSEDDQQKDAGRLRFLFWGAREARVWPFYSSRAADTRSQLRRGIRLPEETGGYRLELRRDHPRRRIPAKWCLSSGEAFVHRSTADRISAEKNPAPRPLAPIQKTRKADRTQAFLSAFLVSLTDIIEDMFPSLSAEDKHRITVTEDAISDHQTGSEKNEGHQHEYQNPHHC